MVSQQGIVIQLMWMNVWLCKMKHWSHDATSDARERSVMGGRGAPGTLPRDTRAPPQIKNGCRRRSPLCGGDTPKSRPRESSAMGGGGVQGTPPRDTRGTPQRGNGRRRIRPLSVRHIRHRGCRRGRRKVRCQKRRPRVGGRGSKETLQKLQPRRKDMIRQVIDNDDGRNHTPGPTIGRQIWTGVVKDLMTMVDEKCQSSSQEPPIRVRGGIINIPNRSRRAMQGQNPQNHHGQRREDRPSRRQRSRRGGPSLPIGRREGRSVQRVVRVHVPKTATWVKARPWETARPWRTARPWETARPRRKWAPPQNIGGEALKLRKWAGPRKIVGKP